MPKLVENLTGLKTENAAVPSSLVLTEKIMKVDVRSPRYSRKMSNTPEKPVTKRKSNPVTGPFKTKSSVRVDSRNDLAYHLNANKERLLYIEEIDMSWTNIEGADLEKLLRAMPLLKGLDIWHCENIKSGTLVKLPRHLFTTLKKVDLSFTLVTNKDIQTLLQAAPHLIHIDLWACQKITEGVFSELKPDSLSALKTARLGTLKIKISDIHDLIRAAPKLTEIHLTDCPYITKSDLETIPEHIAIK